MSRLNYFYRNRIEPGLYRMRGFLLSLNIVVLAVLGMFAKDNLINEFRFWFPSAPISPEPMGVHAEGSIEVVFSPNKGATAAIVRALSQARSSILVSAYNFTSKEIAQALLAAKKRNLQIKVILDKSQMTQRYSSATFFTNQGIDLRIDIKHAIFHNKVMIIDDKTVITGSFNFTKAAETKNAENVLIIRNNKSLAQRYKQDWEEHWNRAISVNAYAAQKKSP